MAPFGELPDSSVKNLIFLYCGLEGLVSWRLVGLGQQEDYFLERSGLRAGGTLSPICGLFSIIRSIETNDPRRSQT